ncbi:hypothetical protein [Streptomyces sp. MB09-02B]|uniref:hypothetical protein n=1 Tax=Streptomyces sp. MB09-02B TaxID=3028667 RepID=UPI0029AF7B4B|nr:hypothetical protein [Streptomyces sp. MB09-02B]MDX3639235.1 hypothetical protein [Streptomyces sp. MB09-02B]
MQCLSLARVPGRWAGAGRATRSVPGGRSAPVVAGRPSAEGPGNEVGHPHREHRFE